MSVVRMVYSEELLLQLERAIEVCPECAGNYLQDKKSYDMLKEVLEPVLSVRNKILYLSSNNTNRRIQTVELDMRAEKLIFECIAKQNDLLNW